MGHQSSFSAFPSFTSGGKDMHRDMHMIGSLCPASLWSALIGQLHTGASQALGPAYLGAHPSANQQRPGKQHSTVVLLQPQALSLCCLSSHCFSKCRAAGTWGARREFAGLWVRQNWTHSPGDIVLGMYLRTKTSVSAPPGSIQLPTKVTVSGAFTLSQGGYRALTYTHCLIYSGAL